MFEDNSAPDCSPGVGNFGFNSYNFLTFMLLGFNAVSNIIANVNNNDNNNNNNVNSNSFGSVQGTSQDTDVTATSMTTVVVIVPPVGPPIPVIVGRALWFGAGKRDLLRSPPQKVKLEPRFQQKPENETFVQFEGKEDKIFMNGTILFGNGSVSKGDLIFGLVNSRDPRTILDLGSTLGLKQPLTWALLRSISSRKKRRRRRNVNGERIDIVGEMLEEYVFILSLAKNTEETKWLKCERDFICAVKIITPFLWAKDECRFQDKNCFKPDE